MFLPVIIKANPKHLLNPKHLSKSNFHKVSNNIQIWMLKLNSLHFTSQISIIFYQIETIYKCTYAWKIFNKQNLWKSMKTWAAFGQWKHVLLCGSLLLDLNVTLAELYSFLLLVHILFINEPGLFILLTCLTGLSYQRMEIWS